MTNLTKFLQTLLKMLDLHQNFQIQAKLGILFFFLCSDFIFYINRQVDARSERVDSFSCLQSIPEKSLLGEMAEHLSITSCKKNSIVGLFTSRLGAKMSTGSSGKPTENKTDHLTTPC